MSTGERSVRDLVTEQWVAAIGDTTADPAADFFEVGGNSLAAMRFIQGVREKTGARIALRTLLYDSTLPRIIAVVEGQLAERPSNGSS